MSSLAAAIASRAPSFGRGGIRWLNLGLLALAALIGIVSYLVVSSAPASDASSVVQQTGTVKRGVVLSSVSATGSVVAAKDLTLNFQSSGTLTHVDVKAGEHVTRGQVLGTIDSTEAAASVRQAQASLTAARASLQVALTGVGHSPPTPADVLGIVSLILWALTVMVSLKYVGRDRRTEKARCAVGDAGEGGRDFGAGSADERQGCGGV